MDPIRFNAIHPPAVPTPAAPPASTVGPSAPTDQVQLGATRSTLLDKAKTVGFVSMGAMLASPLAVAVGAVGLGTAFAAGAGLGCMAASGMAGVALAKKLFGGGKAAAARPLTLMGTAKTLTLASAVGVTAAGFASVAGATGLVAALTVGVACASGIGIGLATIHAGKKLFGPKTQGGSTPSAPPSQPAIPPPPAAAGPGAQAPTFKPDIMAPGVSISGGPSAQDVRITGTGMAAPFAAGRAAAMLADNPGASPAEVREALQKESPLTGPGVPPPPIFR
jgi:hypothetical protein